MRGIATALVFYPIAEALERRDVRSKVAELRKHFALSPAERLAASRGRLVEMLQFAGVHIPYYRDLFARCRFDPDALARDTERLADLPLLTKDIIDEQGERLLSRPLAEIRHHACRTGGSTGRKAVIFYDQAAADYSSAVTAYARERIGATRLQSTLHFAARFHDADQQRWLGREAFKCLAMNRSNIFIDRLDGAALDGIWTTIRQRLPYLIHAHPSTMFALAVHLRDRKVALPAEPVFSVFESSGEVLDERQRRTISEVFGCRIINRYGLAEFGVLAYELESRGGTLELLDSECWAEALPSHSGDPGRLIVTGLRNRLMPLIRYDTGDLATTSKANGVPVLGDLVGRVHDTVELAGVPYLTHHLQDVLDHRVQAIRDFQFDMRTSPPTLRIVLEPTANPLEVASRIRLHWGDAFTLAFVEPQDMVRVGDRAKFRHVVSA